MQPECKNLGFGVPSLMADDKPCPLLQPSLKRSPHSSNKKLFGSTSFFVKVAKSMNLFCFASSLHKSDELKNCPLSNYRHFFFRFVKMGSRSIPLLRFSHLFSKFKSYFKILSPTKCLVWLSFHFGLHKIWFKTQHY